MNQKGWNKRPKWKVVRVHGDEGISYYGSVLNNYLLSYSLGKVTRAMEGTLGVFCFDTMRLAKDFCAESLDYRIFKVLGKGRGTRPKSIAKIWGLSVSRAWIPELLSKYYRNLWIPELLSKHYRDPNPHPVSVSQNTKGMVCYPEVLVLG